MSNIGQARWRQRNLADPAAAWNVCYKRTTLNGTIGHVVGISPTTRPTAHVSPP